MEGLLLKTNTKFKEKVISGVLLGISTVSILANGFYLSNFQVINSKNDVSCIDDNHISVSYKGVSKENPSNNIMIDKCKTENKFVYNVKNLNTGNSLYSFTSDKDIDLKSVMKTNNLSYNQLNAAVGTVIATMATHQVGVVAAIGILTAAGEGGGAIAALGACGDFIALCELMAEGYSLWAILSAGLLSLSGILVIAGSITALL